MKKYTFILALGVALTLTACGSGSATKEATDSTAAQVDTAAVTAVDSTASVVEAPVAPADPAKPAAPATEAVK
jgi:ABC-type Fe3+-hydroxamate transport system substrate-binding protein